MIQVQDLHKSFGAHHVLRGINLNVRTGTTRVILGVSGSGKTVLMKHIIGLLQPDAGTVHVDGQDITRLDQAALLELRRTFGMVFQQAALFDSMTVEENVGFPIVEHTEMPPKARRERVMEVLSLVGLEHAVKKYPSELSGGMRKRVGLARAIVLDPKIVLYDEPTTGLDPLTTDNVEQMILDANHRLKVTSVVISHDIGSAIKVADDIAVLEKGTIVEDCPASQIRESKNPFVQKYLSTWFDKL